jgi:hypothetical protein
MAVAVSAGAAQKRRQIVGCQAAVLSLFLLRLLIAAAESAASTVRKQVAFERYAIEYPKCSDQRMSDCQRLRVLIETD